MSRIIFDLDGTLIDSAPDLHAAAGKLLREMGEEPLDLRTIRGFIGNGVPVLVERIARAVSHPTDTARLAVLEHRFMVLYTAAPAALTRVYPGVQPALAELRAQGHRMSICTNKPAATARKILDLLDIGANFDAVIGGDGPGPLKPDAAPVHAAARALGEAGDALYVGDSEIDAQAAQAAGMPFLLFTQGYRRAPIDEVRFAASFDRFDQLPELVARRCGSASGTGSGLPTSGAT